MESSQFSVNWSSYHSNLSHGFSLLQQREEFVDMTLAADGHFVKVHRSLVCLVSPFIKELVMSMPGPAQHPVIFLDISYDMLCYILEYIYKGELLVPNEKFEKFLTCAKKLHIKGLENLNKGNKTETENVDSPDKPKNVPDYQYDPQNSKQCFPVEQEYMPVYQKHVQADQKHVTINLEHKQADHKHLSINQKLVATDQEHVLADKQFQPENTENITANKICLNTDQEYFPPDQQHVPPNQQHVPLNQHSVPANQKLVQADQKHVPPNKQHTLDNQQYAPFEQKLVQVKQQLVQADEQLVPPKQQYMLVNEQHAPLDQQNMPVNQQLVQADQQHEPLDQKHVLADQKHVLPNQQNMLVNQQHAPLDQQHVSVSQQLVQADQQHEPVDQQHLLADQQHVPAINNNVIMNHEHVQYNQEHVPSIPNIVTMNQKHVQADQKLVSAEQECLPIDQELMSADPPFMPTDQQDLPSDQQPMPSIQQHVPVNDIDVTKKAMDDIISTDKTKVKRKSIRILEEKVYFSGNKAKNSNIKTDNTNRKEKKRKLEKIDKLVIVSAKKPKTSAQILKEAAAQQQAKNTPGTLCIKEDMEKIKPASAFQKAFQDAIANNYLVNITDDILCPENNFHESETISEMTNAHTVTQPYIQNIMDMDYNPPRDHQGIMLEVIQDGCQNITDIYNDVNLTDKIGTYLDTVQQIDESIDQNFQPTRAITKLEIIAQQAQNATKMDIRSNQRTQDFIDTNFREDHQGITLEVIQDGCQNLTAIHNDVNPTNQTDTNLDTVQQYDESINQNHQPSRAITKLEIIAQQVQNATNIDFSSNHKTEDFINANFTIELLPTDEDCNIDETSLDSYSMLDNQGEDLRDLLQTQENSDLVQTFGTQHTMNMPYIDLQSPLVSNIQNLVLQPQEQECKTQAANNQEILTVAQTNMQVPSSSSIVDSIVTQKSGKPRKNRRTPLPKQGRTARNIHELLQQTQESLMADECIPQDRENPSNVPKVSEHSCTRVEQSNMPHIDLTNTDVGCSNGMQVSVVESSKDLLDMRLYTVSNKGSLQLILNRYLYGLHNKGKVYKKRRFRCVDYKNRRCQAYVDIYIDDTLKRVNEHCHEFHDTRIYKKMQKGPVYTSLEVASKECFSRECVANAPVSDSDNDYWNS